MSDYRKRKPKVGDSALHVSNNLDARPVSQVSDDGKQVRLQIGTIETDWIPATNYLYRSAS